MARFDRAARDARAGMLADAPPAAASFAAGGPRRLTPAEAVRAFELERARGGGSGASRAGAPVRLGFEDKVGRVERPSALANDPSRRMHETRGMSRWQARATYGDAGRGPADGIWPPPAVEDAADPDVDPAADPAPDPGTAPHPDHTLDPSSAEHLSRTALALRDRRDAFLASVAAKGPRRPPSPGVHHGRWQDQARGPDPKRHPPDVHAGRHEARAFYGDGGGRSVARSRADIDADGGARHAGRWEDRADWHDPNYHLGMPNHGHYAQHMGRDKWEAGGYLKLPRGVHEPGWKEGCWDEGLWERRAAWAHAPTRPSDPQAGPRGQKPVGPKDESRVLAGVWEARGQWHRDSEGNAPRDVGPLGHVRRGADRHDGRWQARADWGRGDGDGGRDRDKDRDREKDDDRRHEGRWEERATFQGTNRRGETPQARAARIAAANRESARARDEDEERGADDDDADADDDDAAAAARNRNLNARRGGPGGRPALVRPNLADDADERPTWDGDVPAANIPNAREAKEARIRADVAAAAAAAAAGSQKENVVDAEGRLVAWMARGGAGAGAGYTRTPAEYREAYDAVNAAAGARLNHGVAREGYRRDDEEGEGDEGDGGRVRRLDRYRNRNGNLGLGLDEDDAESGSIGLWGMDSVREAIKSASASEATRRERSARTLGSHVGIL